MRSLASDADQFESARLTVDLTSSYQVTKAIAVFFSVRNLTDEPLCIYEGAPNRPIQREFYGVQLRGGRPPFLKRHSP